jgi:ferredoxin-NADP reductase
MTDHKVKLKNSEEVAEGTMAFHFEKPSDFEYKAGQFIRLTLIEPPETDAEGNARNFTLASAPYEADLMIATRMRDSAFKRVLKSMPLGTELELRGPFGNLTLHDDATQPAVFLAGGIGITPFRSIVLQSANARLPHRLFLFYSNRRPEDAAFLDELRELESKNSNYRFIPTMTRPDDSTRLWQGETGYINQEMLTRFIDDMNAPIYYTAGPPAMVDAMKNLLIEAGVDNANIRAEKFAGY